MNFDFEINLFINVDLLDNLQSSYCSKFHSLYPPNDVKGVLFENIPNKLHLAFQFNNTEAISFLGCQNVSVT